MCNLPCKLLIIEDQVKISNLLKRAMEIKFPNAEVLVAHEATTAEQLIREEHPDFVVSDILLPGLNGDQLMKKLMEEGGEPSFVFISGSFAGSGALPEEEVIPKPIDLEALYLTIRSVLNLKQLSKNIREQTRALRQSMDYRGALNVTPIP